MLQVVFYDIKLNILQGSVATRLRCGGIFDNSIARNVLQKSDGKRILKIGQHLTKSEAKIEWFDFFPHTVYLGYPFIVKPYKIV